jgi:hypothetical protein
MKSPLLFAIAVTVLITTISIVEAAPNQRTGYGLPTSCLSLAECVAKGMSSNNFTGRAWPRDQAERWCKQNALVCH